MLDLNTELCPWRTKTLPLKTCHGKNNKIHLTTYPFDVIFTFLFFNHNYGALHNVVTKRGGRIIWEIFGNCLVSQKIKFLLKHPKFKSCAYFGGKHHPITIAFKWEESLHQK